jgi:hypothetical protein
MSLPNTDAPTAPLEPVSPSATKNSAIAITRMPTATTNGGTTETGTNRMSA